jgi:hypothetical protein
MVNNKVCTGGELMKDLTNFADNCWTMFEKMPHHLKTKIVVLGIIHLLSANFKDKFSHFIDVLKAS